MRRSSTATASPASGASVVEFTYRQLREGIEIGVFAPGRRMREVEIARWLGVSRTPVRQALAKLENEGLLTTAPRHGLVVATLDHQATSELYDMRVAMEGTAASLAARNASPVEIAALEAMIDAEKLLPPDPLTLARHNRSFHQLVYAAAHNRYLEKNMQSLNDALELLGVSTLAGKGRPAESVSEHSRIIAAIKSNDAAGAEAAAREHVLNGYRVRLRRDLQRGQ